MKSRRSLTCRLAPRSDISGLGGSGGAPPSGPFVPELGGSGGGAPPPVPFVPELGGSGGAPPPVPFVPELGGSGGAPPPDPPTALIMAASRRACASRDGRGPAAR